MESSGLHHGMRTNFFSLIRKIGLGSILMGLAIIMDAQPRFEVPVLRQHLSGLGMLHVRVAETPTTLTLGMEQGRYRFAPRGMATVLDALAEQQVGMYDTVSIILYNKALPVLLLQQTGAGNTSTRWVRKADIAGIQGIAPEVPATGRLEVILSPGIRYQLGNFDNPVRAALDLQAGMEYLVRPGMTLQGMLALPAHNNFDLKTSLRLERLLAVRDFILAPNAYLSVSGGIFSNNRIGGHIRGKFWGKDERFALRLDAGLTGFTALTGPVYFEETERQLFPVWMAGIEYRWRRYELNMRVNAGRFLYQDDGVSMEVFRQMGERAFGFFASWTTGGSNLGIQCAFPLFPARYQQPRRVRIRVAEQFPFSYRFRGLSLAARRYEPGTMLVDQLYGFYPSFFLKELEHVSEGTGKK